MHLYWGYPQGRNYASIDNILKDDFFFNSHFALYGLFGIHAKDTKFINGTHTHTHRDINVHRHMHTQIQIPFLHFTLFGSFGIYAKDTNFTFGTPHTHTYRYTQTHAHIHVPFLHF